MPSSYTVVLTTLPTLSKARQISSLVLKRKLAACVNIVGPAESSFWWKERIEHAKEYLLLIKTRSSRFGGLRKLLEKNHPYSVPEIIAFPLEKGNAAYLNWLRSSVR